MRSVGVVLACAVLVACAGAAPAPAAPQGVPHEDVLGRARAEIASNVVSERVHGLRALLDVDAGKLQPLLGAISERALHAATPEERAAALWALVHAGDVRAAESALAAYGDGSLERVTKVDGSSAFDPLALARLVATTEVPAEENALRLKLIAAALPKADASDRGLLLRALAQSGDDASSLVAAAQALDPKRDAEIIGRLLQRVKALADPRAADALARYADHASDAQVRTDVALLLAELGDLRAAPHLAWRLGQKPARDDRERVVCARMLAELAQIHPEAHAQLRQIAEAAVIGWMNEHPQPHANALRFLAVVESPKAAPLLRALADPQTPLPAAGASPPFPDEFATAQSALRWLGATHDASAFAILTKQLQRKPASFDASMDSLQQGGNAIAGMTYRALGTGAAEGFSELGDPKAVPLLVKVADDPKQNEQVRIEACTAAAWLADARARGAIVAKVRASASDRKAAWDRNCWLEGLAARPNARVDASLLALLAPKVDYESRHHAARLLGLGGLDAATRDKLVAMLKDPRLVHDAALALLFGGDDASVAKVFETYQPSDTNASPPPMQALQQVYVRSLPAMGEDLYASGALARMASLALEARKAKQGWLLQSLAEQLRSAEYAPEPHAMSRFVLRAKLLADAHGTDAKRRDDAILLLWVLGQRADLASLGPAASSRLSEPPP